jgi:hypothetical protein
VRFRGKVPDRDWDLADEVLVDGVNVKLQLCGDGDNW